MRAGTAAAIGVGAIGIARVVFAVRDAWLAHGLARVGLVVLVLVEALLFGFAALLITNLGRTRLPRGGPSQPGPVDVLIPVRNEDATVLTGTLRAARRMRSPRGGFRVVVVDDSDEEHADALAAVCAAEGAEYVRRSERRGYKAGALNDALAACHAPFVAVLDVDHEPEPAFLVEALCRFEPDVAFVQTVIEWRNEHGLVPRLAGLLQHQFYYGVEVEKAQRGRAVFTGSAAVFRRAAVDSLGGFPEDTLVEDFDMTLRLTNAGWRGEFAPVVGARGLLPYTASDLARQLWRWSHGTTEVLRLRVRETLASRRAPLSARLELLADGSAYLASGVVAGAAVASVALAATGSALLLGPVAIAVAHVTTAAAALRRRGDAAPWGFLVVYHVVSLSLAPVVLAGGLFGALGRARHVEGRVAKLPIDALSKAGPTSRRSS